jgi:hypothetical protein
VGATAPRLRAVRAIEPAGSSRGVCGVVSAPWASPPQLLEDSLAAEAEAVHPGDRDVVRVVEPDGVDARVVEAGCGVEVRRMADRNRRDLAAAQGVDELPLLGAERCGEEHCKGGHRDHCQQRCPDNPKPGRGPDRWHGAGAGAGCPRCSFATRQVSEREDRAADVPAGGWLQRSGQLRRRQAGSVPARVGRRPGSAPGVREWA